MKDRIATFWISKIFEIVHAQKRDRIEIEATRDIRLNGKLSKKKYKDMRDTIWAEIQEDALRWVFTQPPERYAQLPEDSRKSNFPV